MKLQKVLGVIPARFGSTRLPKKMLLEISGKPLFYHTWNQARHSKLLDALVIATDTEEIFAKGEAFGATMLMTSSDIQTGSDRVAAAAKEFSEFTPDIVVNIQGDEPLIPPSAIDRSVQALIEDHVAAVATPSTSFHSLGDVQSPNFVKVVTDKNDYALYFSRSVLPYPRDRYEAYRKHLGLYAYRYDFLQHYVTLEQTPLELAEKLEQLRILENGYKIKVVPGEFPTVEVNTQEEFDAVKKLMEKVS